MHTVPITGLLFMYLCIYAMDNLSDNDYIYPRANGAKRLSRRKPGTRVTNRALDKLKVVGR